MADIVWFMKEVFPWLILAAFILLLLFGPSPRKKKDAVHAKSEGEEK